MSIRLPRLRTLDLFRRRVWKDRRRLANEMVSGRLALRKFATAEEHVAKEAWLLAQLPAHLRRAQVPRLLGVDRESLVAEYVRGTRVFNLLLALDHLSEDQVPRAAEVRADLLDRVSENESELQRALTRLANPVQPVPYPAAEKILEVSQILDDVLDARVSWSRLLPELDRLDADWQQLVSVPYRDATSKNVILGASDLWEGNFANEGARSLFLRDSLAQSGPPGWLEEPLVDFDFATCQYLTTVEDDYISLHYHQVNWSDDKFRRDTFNWSGDRDAERAALTFIVRFFRLGGRKAAYRMLHPTGHAVRFASDLDGIYFARLIDAVEALAPELWLRYPTIRSMARQFAAGLRRPTPRVDWFAISTRFDRDAYYTDLFCEPWAREKAPIRADLDQGAHAHADRAAWAWALPFAHLT